MSANRFCPLLGEAHGPHDFDWSDDGAHYAGHCDGDDSIYAGGPSVRPELAALLVEPLATEVHATAWVYAMHFAGYGTHPDDSGRSIVTAGGARLFTDVEADLYDARMDEAHRLCGDVYLIALHAFEGRPVV